MCAVPTCARSIAADVILALQRTSTLALTQSVENFLVAEKADVAEWQTR